MIFNLIFFYSFNNFKRITTLNSYLENQGNYNTLLSRKLLSTLCKTK